MCFELVERRKVKTQHLVPGSFRIGVNPEKRAKTKKLLLFALTCCVATFAVCGKKWERCRIDVEHLEYFQS